jgi:PhzF family phenazine biosynthesis protein
MGEVRRRTVDSFAHAPLSGNPAGVVMLDESPSDEWMATVARETNLSDTAFVIRTRLSNADFRLRWFTRGPVEDDLCGHATLAAAHCLFEDGVSSPIRFATRSGVLTVSRREDGSLAMDLPAWPPAQVEPPADLANALHAPVAWTGRSGNDHLLALVADERSVRDISPNIGGISRIPADVVKSPRPPTRSSRSTSSLVPSRPTWASTRTRSPAAPIPSWLRSGPTGSVGQRSWACRPPRDRDS